MTLIKENRKLYSMSPVMRAMLIHEHLVDLYNVIWNLEKDWRRDERWRLNLERHS